MKTTRTVYARAKVGFKTFTVAMPDDHPIACALRRTDGIYLTRVHAWQSVVDGRWITLVLP